MLNKKILAASIAAVFSLNASAAVDLDVSPVVSAKYASETVVGQATTTTAGNKEIADGGTNFDVVGNVGFGFTATTSFYVRYDLTNAVFENQVISGDLTLAGITGEVVTVAQGGAEDANFVIFEVVDANEAIGSTEDINLLFGTLGLTGTTDSSIQMRTFASAPDAVNQTGALSDKSGAHVSLISAVTTEFVATNAVADVDDGFTDFTGSKDYAALGTVELTLATASAAVAGGGVTRAEVIADATSTLVVTGDFSTALPTGTGTVSLFTDAVCAAGGAALVVNAGGTAATRTNTTALADGTPMYVCVKPDGTSSIAAAGPYTAVLTSAAGTAGTYAVQNGTLGSITRNGTTLEFPYITTFSDYNQRILMTNNSSVDTTYSCTFTSEAGTTAAAGTAATGTIPGNTTVSFKAVDMVTLTGKTRTAARCTLLSQSTNIDAATTIVNLSDKSTDTVTIN